MGGNVKWVSGMTLYASDDSADSITEAREYVKANGYTAEQVKIVKKEGQVMVIWR
jgi:hypothetical protein